MESATIGLRRLDFFADLLYIYIISVRPERRAQVTDESKENPHE